MKLSAAQGLLFALCLSPLAQAQSSETALNRELQQVIRKRLDAYARGSVTDWASYIHNDCLCGPQSVADLRAEIAHRSPSTRMWYGDIESLSAKRHGDTAVVRYRATEYSDVDGQKLEAPTWRTETHRRHGKGWQLIALSDVPIVADPPVVPVASRILDSFAGSYRYGPTMVDVVTHEGDHLTIQTSGQPKEILSAENENTYFSAGQPWRIIFVRDDAGRVTSLLFRQYGHDLRATRLPP